MGPTTLGSSLIPALRALEGIKLSLEDEISWAFGKRIPPSRNIEKNESSIAIVGMAGRFPEAENLDEFWNLIENGMDVHRKVNIIAILLQVLR